MFTKDEDLLIVAGVGESLRRLIFHTYRTGSNYTCNPPVEDTDIDLYAYVLPSRRKEVEGLMASDGWAECLTESGGQAYVNTPGYGTDWNAYRKDRYNLILVYDLRHFVRCAAATELCKALNLLEKDDRVSVHGMVHLCKDTEMKMPTLMATRSILTTLKNAGMWDYKPPVVTPEQVAEIPRDFALEFAANSARALALEFPNFTFAMNQRSTRSARYNQLDRLDAGLTNEF